MPTSMIEGPGKIIEQHTLDEAKYDIRAGTSVRVLVMRVPSLNRGFKISRSSVKLDSKLSFECFEGVFRFLGITTHTR